MQIDNVYEDVIVEHPVLNAVIDIVIQSIEHYVPSSSNTPQAILAWSDEETLLLDPKYAWLSAPGAIHIQLPKSLDELIEIFTQFKKCEVDINPGLLLPPGQLCWCLDELLKEAIINNWNNVLTRLYKIKNFNNQHWHTWFNEINDKLENAIFSKNHERLDIYVGLIKQHIYSIAVYVSFQPLFHGATFDVINGGAGQVRLVFNSFLTTPNQNNSNNINRLEKYILPACQDQWWIRIGEVLQTIKEKLDEIKACGFDPETVLQGRLGAMIENLQNFAKSIDDLINNKEQWSNPDFITDKATVAFQNIDTFIKHIGSIKRDAASLRMELEREISFANPSIS